MDQYDPDGETQMVKVENGGKEICELRYKEVFRTKPEYEFNMLDAKDLTHKREKELFELKKKGKYFEYE